jgi:hypothetical protein
MRIGLTLRFGLLMLCIAISWTLPLAAQQKGQWVPGQVGLNAGILPGPGITVANLDYFYSSSTLNDANGSATAVNGSYKVWFVENFVYYVPKFKLFRAKLAFAVAQPTVANGSVVLPQFGQSFGGFGFADTYVQPVTLGWSTKRIAFYGAYAFFAPTGRYTPGATNNIGSGYWGNDFLTGTTLYLTKNQGTSANLFTIWGFHGSREQTGNARITPGQTFTDEWGVGQILPLKKDQSMLAQLGGVGYDQWQVSPNEGTVPNPIPGGPPLLPARLLPFYSVHAAGLQANFIMPKKNFSLYFKYYWEYAAQARPIGTAAVFGGTWTWSFPKSAAPSSEHNLLFQNEIHSEARLQR